MISARVIRLNLLETEVIRLGQRSVGVVTGDGISDFLSRRFFLLGLHSGGDRVQGTLDGVGSLLEVRLEKSRRKI
jgi:hypothetical protein